MLTNIKEFVKARLDDIILVIGIILVSLFSFALGYIVSQYQNKEPIKFEVTSAKALALKEINLFSPSVFAQQKLGV